MKKITDGEWMAQRERIRGLSPHCKKVLITVFELGKASNKEIARKTFISQNSVSVTLKMLTKKNMLSSQKKGRESQWTIADPQIAIALSINSRITFDELPDTH